MKRKHALPLYWKVVVDCADPAAGRSAGEPPPLPARRHLNSSSCRCSGWSSSCGTGASLRPAADLIGQAVRRRSILIGQVVRRRSILIDRRRLHSRPRMELLLGDRCDRPSRCPCWIRNGGCRRSRAAHRGTKQRRAGRRRSKPRRTSRRPLRLQKERGRRRAGCPSAERRARERRRAVAAAAPPSRRKIAAAGRL